MSEGASHALMIGGEHSEQPAASSYFLIYYQWSSDQGIH